jgi:hypothetical protein
MRCCGRGEQRGGAGGGIGLEVDDQAAAWAAVVEVVGGAGLGPVTGGGVVLLGGGDAGQAADLAEPWDRQGRVRGPDAEDASGFC